MKQLNATKDGMAAQKLCLVLLKDRTIALDNKIPHDDSKKIIKKINDLSLDLKDEFEGLLKLRHHMDCKLKEVCFDDASKEANDKLFHKISDLGGLQQVCSGNEFLLNIFFLSGIILRCHRGCIKDVLMK